MGVVVNFLNGAHSWKDVNYSRNSPGQRFANFVNIICCYV